MARRRLAETLAVALIVGAPSLGLAQFGGQPGQGGPQGPPMGMPGPPPGMPGAPPRAGGPQTPEMAKRVDAIRVLREIVQMHLGKREISAALPSLRALLQAEKTAQSEAVQALDQEKKALLAARSPEDMPPPPSDKLREQARKLRAEEEKHWGVLAQAIGSPRAGELQRLLNPMRQGPFMPGGMGWPGFGAPGQPGGFPVPGGFGNPGMPPGAARQPGQRPNAGGMPGMSPMAMMDAPYISLEDLISLLEQRLAALK